MRVLLCAACIGLLALPGRYHAHAAAGDYNYDEAVSHAGQFDAEKTYGLPAYIMLAQHFPSNSSYRDAIEDQLDEWVNTAKSPGGLAKIGFEWGTLRHVNNAAFPMFVYSDLTGDEALKTKYYTWAKGQLDYALGSNPDNRCYMVGFQPPGKTTVTFYHSATAYGPYAGWEHLIAGRPEYNKTCRHTMYGHLTGGPDWNDDFQNDAWKARGMANTAQLECALNYMTGFVGNLARMAQEFDGAIVEGFPAAEEREASPSIADDQFFVEARLASSGAQYTEIQAYCNNRSNLPARRSDKLSFRYYFTLEEGVSPEDISVEITGTNEGATISDPIHAFADTYYLSVDFSGEMILPFTWYESGVGYHREYRKEINFRIRCTGSWDTSNDWSYADLSSELAERMRMPVFEDGEYLFGSLPPGAVALSPSPPGYANGNPQEQRKTPTHMYNPQGKRVGMSTSALTKNRAALSAGLYLIAAPRNARGVVTEMVVGGTPFAR